jgi:hypothetical protein
LPNNERQLLKNGLALVTDSFVAALVAIPEELDLLSFLRDAGVAKLVYAPDSKSGEVKLMSVRVRPPAPSFNKAGVFLSSPRTALATARLDKERSCQ